MVEFDIDKFSEDNGLDVEVVRFVISSATGHIYKTALERLVNSAGASIIDSLESKKPEALTFSSGLEDVKRKSKRGEFYAPHRETITCEATASYPCDKTRMMVVFRSVAGMEYGNGPLQVFEYAMAMSANEVTDLFYSTEHSAEGGEMQRARDEVSRTIPNLIQPSDIPDNFMRFLYNLDVKRPVADYRKPVQVLSITPCGVLENAGDK